MWLTGIQGRVLFSCVTLELPWKDNKRMVSCIPSGTYTISPRKTGKYAGKAFHVENVEGREHILIHAGNYTSHILGCILVGRQHVDINLDGIIDVSSSGETVKELQKHIRDQTIKLKIIGKI